MKKENIVFGIRSVMEALKAGKEIDKLLVRRTAGSELYREMLTMLKDLEIPVQRVPEEKLNSITRKNHQGVIAFLSEISYSDITMLLPAIYEKGESPLILVLDGISDVRNFGAIARSAECAGVHAIIVPKRGSAMINAEAIKTSAGALHKVPVCRHDDLYKIASYLKDSGLRLIASSDKGNSDLFTEDMSGPVAVIIGSEDLGVSHGLLRLSDMLVSIPMQGSISSLNVSVAAGVLLFEVIRQRREDHSSGN